MRKIRELIKHNIVNVWSLVKRKKQFFDEWFFLVLLVFFIVFSVLIIVLIAKDWSKTTFRTITEVSGSENLNVKGVQELYINILNISNDSMAEFDVHFRTNKPEIFANKDFKIIVYSGEKSRAYSSNYADGTLITNGKIPDDFTQYFLEEGNLKIKIERESVINLFKNQDLGSIFFPGTYPFDRYFIRLQFALLCDDKIIETSHIFYELSDISFVNNERPSSFQLEEPFSGSFSVVIERSYFKYLIIVVLLFLVILILFTYWHILSSSSDRIDILVLNVSVILGIPDMRGFLVPNGIAYAPLIDLFLIILLLLSLFGIGIYINKKIN